MSPLHTLYTLYDLPLPIRKLTRRYGVSQVLLTPQPMSLPILPSTWRQLKLLPETTFGKLLCAALCSCISYGRKQAVIWFIVYVQGNL